MKYLLLIIPPLIMTYALIGAPIKNMCENGEFSYFPVPNCSVSMGEALEKQGFPSTVGGDLPECNEVEKGWCVKSYGETVTHNDQTFQMATVTPKGFLLSF